MPNPITPARLSSAQREELMEVITRHAGGRVSERGGRTHVDLPSGLRHTIKGGENVYRFANSARVDWMALPVTETSLSGLSDMQARVTAEGLIKSVSRSHVTSVDEWVLAVDHALAYGGIVEDIDVPLKVVLQEVMTLPHMQTQAASLFAASGFAVEQEIEQLTRQLMLTLDTLGVHLYSAELEQRLHHRVESTYLDANDRSKIADPGFLMTAFERLKTEAATPAEFVKLAHRHAALNNINMTVGELSAESWRPDFMAEEVKSALLAYHGGNADALTGVAFAYRHRDPIEYRREPAGDNVARLIERARGSVSMMSQLVKERSAKLPAYLSTRLGDLRQQIEAGLAQTTSLSACYDMVKISDRCLDKRLYDTRPGMAQPVLDALEKQVAVAMGQPVPAPEPEVEPAVEPVPEPEVEPAVEPVPAPVVEAPVKVAPVETVEPTPAQEPESPVASEPAPKPEPESAPEQTAPASAAPDVVAPEPTPAPADTPSLIAQLDALHQATTDVMFKGDELVMDDAYDWSTLLWDRLPSGTDFSSLSPEQAEQAWQYASSVFAPLLDRPNKRKTTQWLEASFTADEQAKQIKAQIKTLREGFGTDAQKVDEATLKPLMNALVTPLFAVKEASGMLYHLDAPLVNQVAEDVEMLCAYAQDGTSHKAEIEARVDALKAPAPAVEAKPAI
jgi:hypothetical protein